MDIPRAIEPIFLERLTQYPVVTVTGPRQSGKTTLVRRLCDQYPYVVDEKQKSGQYILTGSHQLALHEALAQSLAGRTTLLQLLPLSFVELQKNHIVYPENDFMLRGFYPRIYHGNSPDPKVIYSDYVKTYLERDVRRLINIKDLMLFQKFMRLCASRTGTVLNMNDLANDVGVSHNTIREWISVLQASYLIELIAPYFENIGKRVIKS